MSIFFALSIGLFCLPFLLVHAEETYVLDTTYQSPKTYFTKYTWLTTPHPNVASFTAITDNNFVGTTTTGVPFSQYLVPTETKTRVHKFEIQNHFHFIVEGKIVGSLEALSTQLALAYNALNQ